MKKIISVLLVLSLLLFAGMASLSAQGEENGLVVTHEDKITASRFETMLNNNYAFGKDFESVSKLISAASISLLPHAENGTLKNSLIVDFARNMYGLDLLTMADINSEPLEENGVYQIIPKGFSKYNHTVTNFYRHNDATLTVYSIAETTDEEDEAVKYSAISRFAQNQNSVFGYTLLSCEIIINE